MKRVSIHTLNKVFESRIRLGVMSVLMLGKRILSVDLKVWENLIKRDKLGFGAGVIREGITRCMEIIILRLKSLGRNLIPII